MKKKSKYVLICVLIFMFIATTPVLANSIAKSIDVIFNSVKVQVNGENKNVDSILYNGTTYLPMRKVAELVGKEIEWNQETKTANIIDKKTVTTKSPYIVEQGFINSGTTTMYNVKFSDGFAVGIGVPKQTAQEINPLFEFVQLIVNVKEMNSADTITTPNVVGFNEYLGYKYYPVGYDGYKNDLPDEVKNGFKNIDFFENFKLYKNGDTSIKGLVYYESFPLLEGITYDDGVHKCTLYLEDKVR